MCGIAGLYNGVEGGSDTLGVLRRMTGAIAHRGPDADGHTVLPGVGLGHRRLSIIDLATGQQPMSAADGAVWITFNGEIFNYVELRDTLASKGFRFRTTSDTEVILALYLDKGIECVGDLNGDFAFAIWDARSRQLLLARDRMGVRPLFYAQRGTGLAFASEVSALAAVPGITLELDPVALDQICTLWAPIAPRTAFAGISELPPAHRLVAKGGSVRVERYWQMPYPDAADTAAFDNRPEREIAAELRAILDDATRIRLRSDVPVGSYLSGGLDSSVVSAIAARQVPDVLRTFSVTFDIPEFDESAQQQEMVASIGTSHDSILCTAETIAGCFPKVVAHAERPIVRTAPAPLFALAKKVHDSGFKVVLTGEGADEILGGYDIFKEAKIRRFCAAQPGSTARPHLLRKLYPYLPAFKGQPQAYLQAFFGAGSESTDDPLFSHLPRFRSTSGVKAFFSDEVREALKGYDALDELRASLPAEFHRWNPLCQGQYLEATYLMPGYILSSQGDRMAMAHAVEGRFPFLDPRLIDFAARLPAKVKIQGLREKHILREATKDLLPRSIGRRPKQPYRAPESRAFFGEREPAYVGEVLSAASLAAGRSFDPGAVGKLLVKCRAGRATSARDNMALTAILSTQLWHREFSGRVAADAPQAAAS